MMKHPKHLLTLLMVSTALATLGAQPGQTRKLNVLFIISDDLRTELGTYGSQLAKSPNIDALAAAGVRFDRAYTQFPLCNPTRVSMLTGRRPAATGVMGNRADFRIAHPDWITLPQLFKQNGYATLRTGKIFHGGIDDAVSWTEGGDPRRTLPPEGGAALRGAKPDVPNSGRANATRAQNSDRWVVLDGNGEKHGDYAVADRAIGYLREHKDTPFFLAVGFVKPHSPPTAPKRFFDLWDVEKIPLPVNFAPRPTVPAGFPKASIRPRNADLFIGRDASEGDAKEMIRAFCADAE